MVQLYGMDEKCSRLVLHMDSRGAETSVVFLLGGLYVAGIHGNLVRMYST